MKRSEVELHLQTLFRNKNTRHTEALCAFTTNGKGDANELFPDSVVTKKHGEWTLKECGHKPQMDGMWKTWATYERILPEEVKEEEVDDGQSTDV